MTAEALTSERLRAMDVDEAAAWFMARRADRLTATEQRLLAEWLAADKAHRRALERAERAWGAFDEAEGDEILGAMRAHALRSRPHQRGRGTWWPMVAAAALLLTVFGAGALFVPRLTPADPPPRAGPGEASGVVEYVSARGEVKEIILPDGSRMTLDAESAAVARFTAETRSLQLVRGRALFDVKPEPSRLFAVTAGDRRVLVVATRFEVDLAADSLSVTLFEGRVTVAPAIGRGSAVALQPGQQFVQRSGRRVVRTLGERAETAAGWRQGLLTFNDTTLAEAVAEVNRYSREQIVIHDPEVASMRISGQFSAGEAERFARTVAELQPVRVVSGPDGIELKAAE